LTSCSSANQPPVAMATPGTLAPKPRSGSLEKAHSTPVPVIHEEPTKQPLERARTLSVVSTDSSTSALSPNSTPFQSPLSESAGFWTPQSSAASNFSTGFPPGFTPGQLVLGPLPRTSSVVSTGSAISLNRTSSINAGRPYPPGLGWTPQVTPHDEGLQRKLSFGFSLDEPRLRRTCTDLDAVLESQMQDHYFSRELLLFYAGALGEPQETPTDPAEVGFLWPKPGFFRMQAIEPEKPEKLEKPQKREKIKVENGTKESKPKKQPKAEPKDLTPSPSKALNANEGAAGQAVQKGKGMASNQGWKGYGKGQGWTPGWQQGWSKGWSKGWDGWGW